VKFLVIEAGDVADAIADTAMDPVILDIGKDVGLDDGEVHALQIKQVGDVLDRPVAGDRQDPEPGRGIVENLAHVGGNAQIGAALIAGHHADDRRGRRLRRLGRLLGSGRCCKAEQG
jgi:hypothetical protein